MVLSQANHEEMAELKRAQLEKQLQAAREANQAQERELIAAITDRVGHEKFCEWLDSKFPTDEYSTTQFNQAARAFLDGLNGAEQ
jgi:hypothetical protein